MLGAGAGGDGLLVTAMGVGGVVGPIEPAFRPASGITPMARSAAGCGVLVVLLALAPALWAAVAVCAFVGSRSVRFISVAGVTLQFAAHGDMRGRILGLWLTAIAGTTAVGGPLVGEIVDAAGARVALLVGGCAAALAAAGSLLMDRRPARDRPGAPRTRPAAVRPPRAP